MNDGIDQRTVTRPLTRPASTPTPTQAESARGTGQCQRVSVTPRTAAPSAITDPTERSMPPAISTSVMPTTITASAGSWLASVVNVTRDRKCSLVTLKSATSTASTRTSPVDSRIAPRSRPGCGRIVAPSTAATAPTPRPPRHVVTPGPANAAAISERLAPLAAGERASHPSASTAPRCGRRAS